jgi:hypothetical protein
MAAEEGRYVPQQQEPHTAALTLSTKLWTYNHF